MTREEAIKTLRELWRETNDSWYEEAYDMAIEALQFADKSPRTVKLTEDIVVTLDEDAYEIGYTHGQMADRPSGEWKRLIEYVPESDEGLINFDGYQCSACGGKVWVGDFDFWNYCPNCGAIMENKE